MTSSHDPSKATAQSTGRNDVCQVCGDYAVIVNYGVLSCSPCRTFFRRNAYRPQVRILKKIHFPLMIFSLTGDSCLPSCWSL
ncbi:MAG: hypothetical protein IT212_13250 [Bacteroidia bacterium]|nr:hypothetical protein [Bacteroidia bacterium]